MAEITKEMIKAYALKNAIEHKGDANQSAVLSGLFSEGLEKHKIKDTMLKINEIIKEINKLSLQERIKEYEKIEHHTKKRQSREPGMLPPLPEAEQGKVVMRLAPFPSGPLHIGNARPYILNDEYVKNYSGKLILVLDDTISGETKPVEPEAYKLIPQGFKWLKINYNKKIIYKSDRNNIYYKYAEKLIEKGYMYVCSCNQDEVKILREKGIECGCRQLPEKIQLERWKKMFTANPGEFTVRLKTNMQHPNPAFRDRIMFRISDREHPRVGKKYRVWPLLEFSWAIDDHLLGITHILRGIDLIMETEVEKFIWDIFRWKYPTIIHTGFFKIEGVKISKSKGAQEVKSGAYIGWNDPRLWSLQSLKARGIQPEAIREFIINMGITKANSTVSVDVLYALNRKHLENVSRYFFVPEPVKIKISGCPEIKAKIPLHPSLNKGFREYTTSQEFFISKQDFDLIENKKYRLMHLLNFETDQILITKPRLFSFISELPDKNLEVKYLQWLPADKENSNKLAKVIIRMPDNSIITGLGDNELLKLKPGTNIQFERFGFCCLHKLNKSKKIIEFWFAHN